MRAALRTRSTGTDLLVSVWELLAAGREDEARQKLLLVWKNYMDEVAGEQGGRVALRLFERLGFSTDDQDGWARLPDEIPVWRAGPDGISWTADREVGEGLASRLETPLRTGTVAKRDVLAYISGRGEVEIVVRPERVAVGL